MLRTSLLVIATVAAIGARAGEPPRTSTTSTVEGALGQIRPELVRAHMRLLSDDLLEGREPGTRGHRLAALYVATQLEGLGLEPAGDGGTYLQSMRLTRSRPLEVECSLVLRAGGPDRALAYGSDFVMFVDPAGPDAVLRAPVAFVGYGVSSPGDRYDDYAGIDVSGKIVACLGGAPGSFADAPGAFFGDPSLKRETAARHGAVGILQLALPDEESGWDATVAGAKRGTMALSDARDARAPYLAHLSPSGVAALFEREAGWQEALADVKAGKPHSFVTTRELSVRQHTERSALDSPNVVGLLRGADARLRNEYVAYTAHLDHLGVGEPAGGDTIYNGARDNASGVAGLLAVARAFASLAPRPRRSVVFLATTAEEPGALGASHFVDHPPVPLQEVVAEINLDGLAVFWPLRDVAGWGARHSSLGFAVEEATRRLGLEATLPDKDGKVLMGFSDQAPFARKGIPVVWLVYGDKSRDPAVDPAALERKWAQAHRPGDDMGQPFDFGSSVKLSQAAFLTGYIVANDARRPSWHEGDFFGQRFGLRASLAASPSDRPPPSLRDLLSLAGRYVTRLEEELAVLVADETYTQSLFVGRDNSARHRRSLVSEVAWVPTGDAFVWAFFRDVREVDGDLVRDREARLEQLFPSGVTLAGTQRALQILEESSRYNLGRRRTVNSPTVALSFLHPRNQPRFAFHLDGRDEKEGVATWKVRFSEKERPALTRTTLGQDVPARGHLWIEAGSGALVASRLELRPPGPGPVVIETVYGRDDRLGGWLPTEMREAHGNRSRSGAEERVEAVARYSAWRRAQVDVQIILPER